ncbi:unnamed protein product, partial [Mesorhabditis spiculigera]
MDEQQLELRMLSRVGRTASTDIIEESASLSRYKVLIEKKVKSRVTPSVKIALQYSVAVSDSETSQQPGE